MLDSLFVTCDEIRARLSGSTQDENQVHDILASLAAAGIPLSEEPAADAQTEAEKTADENDPVYVYVRETCREEAHGLQAHLRLVVLIAERYGPPAVPILDVIPVGNAALLKAIETFDPTRGCRFSTYATWMVYQAIKLHRAP